MPDRSHHLELLEREDEVAEIDRHLRAAVCGRGGVIVLEGEAGIGKTSLLAVADQLGRRAGLSPLRARAGEMETGFAFGVIRQLFERLMTSSDPTDRERWLAGAAALAKPVVMGYPPGNALGQDLFSTFHGLHWLVANIADDGPLALLVDDGQWADAASLRFLSFLQHRLEPLPVLLLVAARPGRKEVDALASDPTSQVLRPRPLSSRAVAEQVTAAFGRAPDDRFVESCHTATGGNPFLVDELIREAHHQHLTSDAASAPAVAQLTPRAVSIAVLLRLAGLPDAARTLVRSMAVLEAADPDTAAAHAELDKDLAAAAASSLVEAGVLAAGPRLEFVHPIVRAAVHAELGADERLAAHGRAARLLLEQGASAEEVAGHLLSPADDAPGAGELLRRAADRSLATGSPETAVTYLRRALGLADPAELPDVLTELGRAEGAAGLPEADSRLLQAMSVADRADRAAGAAVALARIRRYAGDGTGALDILNRAASEHGPLPPQLEQALDLERLASASMSGPARLRLARWTETRLKEPSGPAHDPWDHLSLATLALDGALSGLPVPAIEDLAARALAGSDLLPDRAVGGQVRSMSGLAYLCSDRFLPAAAIFDGLVTGSAKAGLVGAHANALACRASLHLRRGRLADAETDALRAIELADEVTGTRSLRPRAAAVLVSVAAERGHRPPERMLTEGIDPDSLTSRLLLHARAELLLAEGRLHEAAAGLEAYGERNVLYGWAGVATPWRSQAALARHGLGEASRARALVDDEQERAERHGSPRAIGVALHAAGLMAEGRERRTLLGRAVEALEESGATLARAWALAHLGAERRRNGDRSPARELLRVSHDLALGCQADRLVALTREELRLAGARPRRSRVTGPESLTPSERGVVDLVVEGLTNRQAAQALFVSEKTVETHLAHAYAKLGVRSRQELPATMIRGRSEP